MRVSGPGGGNWEDCRDISKGISKLKCVTECFPGVWLNGLFSWGVTECYQIPPRSALAKGKYGRRAMGGVGAACRCPCSEIVAQLFIEHVVRPFHFCFLFLSIST